MPMIRRSSVVQAPKYARRLGWRTARKIRRLSSSRSPSLHERRTSLSATGSPPGPSAHQTSPAPPTPSRSTRRKPGTGSAPAAPKFQGASTLDAMVDLHDASAADRGEDQDHTHETMLVTKRSLKSSCKASVDSMGFSLLVVTSPPQATASYVQGSSLFQDAQSGEESTDLRCVSAKCLRDVGYAHGPQQADRRVSEGSHHFRTGTLADPARVLAHCDVTYVVRTILDRPMPPGPFEQLSRAGHRPRNTGDEVADLVRGLAVLDHLALDLSDLANTRPIQIIVQRRRRLQRATLDSTVSLVEGRRRVHGVIPDSLLPRGKKPLPREGRRPSGCHSGASVGCL